MKSTFSLILTMLFFTTAFGQEVSTDTIESSNQGPQIPEIDTFHHNKISPVNAVNPELAIYNTVNVTANQLITASISLEEQSIILSPFHFKQRKLQLFDLAIKAALKDNLTYLGSGIKLNFGNKRFNKIYNRNKAKYLGLYNNIANMTNENMRDIEMDKFKKIYKRDFINDVNKQFNKGNIIIHASGMALLFNSPQDSLAANSEVLKGFNVSGGGSITFSEKFGIHLNYNYSERKANASESAVAVAYNGFSATLSKLFTINNDYLDSENYWLHGFIPGLEVGLVIEYEEAFNNFNFAENGIINQTSIGLMFDVKLNPKMQLRLGLPYKMIEFENNSTDNRLNAVVQYNLQIGEF